MRLADFDSPPIPPRPGRNSTPDYEPEWIPLDLYEAELGLSEPPAATQHGDSDGWRFLDLEPILAGTWDPPRPTIGLRTDGTGILYQGRVNSIASEPGAGKTLTALGQAAEQIRAGLRAALIDYEDTPAAIIDRLRRLGLTDSEILARFTYIQPSGPLIDRAGRIQAATLRRLEDLGADLVIIDSVGESLAVEGLNQNDDDAVAQWFRRLPRMLARTGAAVLCLDHVTKSREGRGHYAIGSQRKLAAIDGAAYALEVRTAPTRSRDGRLRLICAKDRHGTFERGAPVAEVTIRTTGDGIEVTLTPPAEKFRPTHLMEAVSRYLESAESASGAAIEREVRGKAEYVRAARDILTAEGYVTAEAGSRGHLYRSARPYREADENPPRPARPNLVPKKRDEVLSHTPTDLVPRPPLTGTRTSRGAEPTPDEPASLLDDLDLVPRDGDEVTDTGEAGR